MPAALAMIRGRPIRPGPGTDRVLLIQLGDIGDVVMTTPTIRAVKETLPGALLSVLVRGGYGSLLRCDPCIAAVHEASKGRGAVAGGAANIRLVRRLRRARYDLAIDLRTGDRGAILAFLSGARGKVGRYEAGKPFWRNRIYDTLVVDPPTAPPPVHPGADQSLRVVRELGIDTRDSRPRLHLCGADLALARGLLEREGAAAHAGFVTVNPFSRWKYKEWGYGNWVEVLDRLWAERGLPAAVIGAREEAAAAGAIVSKCAGPAFNLAGKTSLGELAALLSLSRLHAGVDSAAPHIAAAVGTPTVTIFGPTDWRAWTVPDATHRVVTPDDACAPCHRKGCDDTERSRCLEALPAGTVVAAIGDVLDAAGDGATRESPSA